MMPAAANQFRRIWSDDGRDDKDFSEQEIAVRASMDKLFKATDLLRQASDLLSHLVKSKGLPRPK